jgi:hypothetical protein
MKSIVHSSLSGRQLGNGPMPFERENCGEYRALSKVGVDFPPKVLSQMVAMDDTQGLVTTASIGTPVQFLQAWLPGVVRVLTNARKIDEAIGIQTVGSWEDEEVVQTVLENTGKANLYGDYTNVPLASWNTNFIRRTVVRFEDGLMVGVLEEARAARQQVSSSGEKRISSALALDIERNRVGFYGFNGGANRTYGFLNDPSLPAYQTAATGGSGTTWASKNYLEICNDIRTMVARLVVSTGDNFDPEKDAMTLTVASAVVEYLGVVSDNGSRNSVREWIRATYPKMRIVSAPRAAQVGAGGCRGRAALPG